MVQMVPVADDDGLQRYGSIAADGARNRISRGWNSLYHVRQVQVEMRPEPDEVRPVGILITL